MTTEEFKAYIESTGAGFLHVGFVVRDNDAVMAALAFIKLRHLLE